MRKILLILSLFILPAGLMAQETKPVSFAYDAGFHTYFDNRENAKGGHGGDFSNSMTIFGARLSPVVGIRINQDSTTVHKIMVGDDLLASFGSPKGLSIKDVLLYYDMRTSLSKKVKMEVTAGLFPRSFAKGRYTEAFFSDSLRFYDPNYEGLLFCFDRPRSHYEIGVDWLGMKSGDSRERFMIFSASEGYITDWLKLGYAAFMYHFAASDKVWGVCDNILANPYVEFDLSKVLPLEKFYFNLGYLQSAEKDRRNGDGVKLPMGGEIEACIRKWGVGIRNNLYFGYDLMPLYNQHDFDGTKYGTDLCFGEPYYRVRADGSASSVPGLYDRLEACYEPMIVPGLHLKIAAVFHFNGGLSGSQQIISLKVNIDELKDSVKR